MMRTKRHLAKVSVVIPAFNEAGNLPKLLMNILEVLEASENYEVIFVDDGSSDETLDVLKTLHDMNENVHFVSLSRNFGHQYALKAGLDHATGDCVISMDADLQHPPALIPEMIAKWRQGYDVVNTHRNANGNLSFFKRTTSSLFYRTINVLSPVKIEEGAADFRLIDRAVADVLKRSVERDPFFRGLIPWMGFRTYTLNYDLTPRFSGKTKYSPKKMFLFAANGITSFSTRPLQFATILGACISMLAFLYGLTAIYSYIQGNVVPGWTSVLASVLFIGGLQLLILGIIGGYLGKLFNQSKHRPLYIVRERDSGLDEASALSSALAEFSDDRVAV